MSEQNEQLPLTRRERRMREMGETGAMDLSEVSAAPVEETPEVPATPAQAAQNAGDVEIEISPVNEDGTPRSRREMRQLREEALAALEARAAEAEAPAADAPDVPVVAAQGEASEPAANAEPTEVVEPVGVDQPAAVVEPVVVAEPIETPASDEVAETSDVEMPLVDAVDAAPGEVPAETVAAEIIEDNAEPAAATEPEAAPDFDTLIAPPTEPFTVEELREASRAAEQATGEPSSSVADLESDSAPEAASPSVVTDSSTSTLDAPHGSPAEAEEIAQAGKPKRRFPWSRSKNTDAAPANAPVETETVVDPEPVPEATEHPVVIDEAAAVEIATEAVAVEPDQVDAAVIEDLSVDAEVAEASPTDAPIDDEADGAAEAADAAVATEAGGDAHTTPATTGYSFPDIVPPEEWRSVFDDPASRPTPAPRPGTQPGGDFDDLISRAVAQEGASASSNTSALILPSMPDDTGGLSGPLGGTGELYLTGSIELPKSLGETGGHSALHDSIEMDPIVGHAPAEAQVTADHGPAPVSARHAVSARVPSSIPVVAKPTKERSKLPLVLSLTGGGLLIAVVGLGVWGASNGMFG